MWQYEYTFVLYRARRTREFFLPMTNEQEVAFFVRPFQTQETMHPTNILRLLWRFRARTLRAFCGSRADLRSNFEPCGITGQARAAICGPQPRSSICFGRPSEGGACSSGQFRAPQRSRAAHFERPGEAERLERPIRAPQRCRAGLKSEFQ